MVVSAAPAEVEVPRSADNPVSDKPWVTIVWNDPVNLMSYVTYVFQTRLRLPEAEGARKLMLDVHHKGKAIVAAGREGSHGADVEVCTATACGRR